MLWKRLDEIRHFLQQQCRLFGAWGSPRTRDLGKIGKTRRVGRAVTGTPRRPKKILLINSRRSARTLTGVGGPEDPRALDFSIRERSAIVHLEKWPPRNSRRDERAVTAISSRRGERAVTGTAIPVVVSAP